MNKKILNRILIEWDNSDIDQDSNGLLSQNSFYDLNDHIEEVQEYLKNNIIDVYTRIYDYIYFCASHILMNPGNKLSFITHSKEMLDTWLSYDAASDIGMVGKDDYEINVNFTMNDIFFEPCSLARGIYSDEYRSLRSDIEDIINGLLKKVDGLGTLYKKYKFYYGDFIGYMTSFLNENIGISVHFEKTDTKNPDYTFDSPFEFKYIKKVFININDIYWKKGKGFLDLHEMGYMLAVEKAEPSNMIKFDLPFDTDLCIDGFKLSKYWDDNNTKIQLTHTI